MVKSTESFTISSSATPRPRSEGRERPLERAEGTIVKRAGGRRGARWRPATRLLIAVAGWLVYLGLLLLKWTTRWRLEGGDWLLEAGREGDRVIYAFWHDRLVMMPLLVALRPGVCVMNSRHRDGEIITRAVRRLGVKVVRGSSTRGWSAGLRGMLGAAEAGLDLAMVIDGPRGPRHVAKGGAVALAQATGRKLVPLSYACSWGIRLRSWDRLEIPLPLARIVFIAGRAITVANGASPRKKEEARVALERELCRIGRRAEEILLERDARPAASRNDASGAGPPLD